MAKKKAKRQPDGATRVAFLMCGVVFAAVWTPWCLLIALLAFIPSWEVPEAPDTRTEAEKALSRPHTWELMRPSARARLRRVDPELAAKLEADADLRMEEAAKQLRKQHGMEE